MAHWFEIENVDEIPSPALLIYLDRVKYNMEKMIEIGGGTDRLWPHVKTHKLPQLIRMQVDYGITKFKCATIAEAEMVAENGAEKILMAYPLLGPNIKRLVTLIGQYPKVAFSVIVDHEMTLAGLSRIATNANVTISVFLDIDSGMHRTGIPPGKRALSIYKLIEDSPNLTTGGLHVYDGHIRDNDFEVRQSRCENEFEKVQEFMNSIREEGLGVPTLITGGSPTFPIHALHKNRALSPGTTIFWDYGYSSKFADMQFLHAAVLLTRVVSKPDKGLTCLDLGHKAVASEMPHPRVKLLGVDSYGMIGHSEEHLVIKNESSPAEIGQAFYAIPYHICPTVSLHHEAHIVENNEVVDTWEIVARKRKISI